MICALLLAWSSNVAYADTTATAQMSIAPSGQVIVRDAKVVSISGTTITVRSSWGAFGIVWTVETTGSTRFVPGAIASADALKAIEVGDLIGFSGELDTAAGKATVRATVVRDAALQQDATTSVGTVLSINTSNRTFTLSEKDATTTVAMASGTLMTRDGNAATLSDLKVDDNVKVIGSLNTVTRTLTADRITWKSAVESVRAPSGGIFSGLMAWLEGSRGLFSSR